MNTDPFDDERPANTVGIPQGSYDFLQVTLRLTVGGALTTPAEDAFERTDVRVIYDPAGADVTNQFVTNALDPTGVGDPSVTDTYNAAHATYVGDEAVPENIGLFWDNNAKIVQKVKAPVGATVSLNTNLPPYRIEWLVKKGTTLIPKVEYFHVSPAGVLVLDVGYVTAEEVRAGISTGLTDPEIEMLITEASEYVSGRLEQVGIDLTTLGTLPKLVKTAIIWMTRYLIFQLDASAYRKTSSLTEGDTRIAFTGNSQKDADALLALVNATLDAYIGMGLGIKTPKVNVIQLGRPYRDAGIER